MQLAKLRVVGVGPFDDLTLPLTDEEGRVRRVLVLVGGGGVGKSSLLTSIALTRPGCAMPIPRARSASAGPVFVVADWVLGDDDPQRPHALRVASPNAALDEPEDYATLRRREQSLFDRRAQEGGFVAVALSGARWFSRAPVLLASPERSIVRYDVRAAPSFDDATRADLARETKQILSYGGIAAALGGATGLDATLRDVVTGLTRLSGFSYAGVDPVTLEPLFDGERGLVMFDELPTSVRHLAAIGALTVRALYAAYPGRDPRGAEGVVLVDDVELHQDTGVQRALVPALKSVLPNVQWILTTASPSLALGCETGEVVALRRMPQSDKIEIYQGELAVTH
jgi:hypothetical protein